MVYSVPIIIGWEWFPHRKGVVSGIILSGNGLGPFIFGFISSKLVNPESFTKIADESGKKVYYSQEIADRVPGMYYKCLIAWLSLSLIGVLLISRNPEYVQKNQ
jgi:MFS family permease